MVCNPTPATCMAASMHSFILSLALCDWRYAVSGVELALRHMRVGQQCMIRCESRFAYGPDGCPATKGGDVDLPPYSDIEVRIELLDVQPTASAPSIEETIAEGKRRKVVGNGHFERKAYKKALRAYTSAANTIAGLEFPEGDANAFRAARQLQIDCGNNIATTCVRLGDLEKAKEATLGVLELDSANGKALFRAGQVSSLQGNFAEAKLALQKARELNPDSKEIQAELQHLSARKKAYKQKTQALQEAMGRSLLWGSTRPNDHQGTGSDPDVVVGSAGQEGGREVTRLPEKGAPGVDPDKRESSMLLHGKRYRRALVCVLAALAAWGVKYFADRLLSPMSQNEMTAVLP